MATNREAISQQVAAFLQEDAQRFKELEAVGKQITKDVSRNGLTPENKGRLIDWHKNKVEAIIKSLANIRYLKQSAAALHGIESFMSEVLAIEIDSVKMLNNARNELNRARKEYD